MEASNNALALDNPSTTCNLHKVSQYPLENKIPSNTTTTEDTVPLSNVNQSQNSAESLDEDQRNECNKGFAEIQVAH
ncbi:BTE_collapsed_G0004260.mRNA.1.CDS.1 [Saccharomyces cerevisiae]|nr:BTE_collapsed_G0004260.mRNA.1.CDS.1 [Saccharomyces cerevisiae]